MNIWVPIILLFIILSIIFYNFTIKKEDESAYPSLIIIFIILYVIVFYLYFYRKDITTYYSSKIITPNSKTINIKKYTPTPGDIKYHKKILVNNRKNTIPYAPSTGNFEYYPSEFEYHRNTTRYFPSTNRFTHLHS